MTPDIDGSRLVIVRADPHYGSACHVVRADDGSYSQLFPGAISGDVFEQVVNGKTHICLDKGPEGFLLIDPETQGIFE